MAPSALPLGPGLTADGVKKFSSSAECLSSLLLSDYRGYYTESKEVGT